MGMYDTITVWPRDRTHCAEGHALGDLQTKSLECLMHRYVVFDGALYRVVEHDRETVVAAEGGRPVRRRARRAAEDPMTTIRSARADDLPAVIDIYNYEVEHGVATFDTVPWTLEERAPWFAVHASPQHPLIVAEEDGRVLGWGSLSAWSDRCAYARAAEVSVYVHQDHRGRGIGRSLLAELIARGRAAGPGVLLARIESSGGASLAL